MEFNEENIIHQFASRRTITSREFRRIFGLDYVNGKLRLMEKKGILKSTKEKIPNIDGKLYYQRVWKLT
jgi:hypothetical protein